MRKLLLLALCSAFAATNVAAQDGTITIKGRVGTESSITVIDDGVTLDPLGQGYSNEKVGSVVINSNAIGGFSVQLSSANGGYIARPGGEAIDNQRLDYSLTLTQSSGQPGNGITVPNLSEIDPDSTLPFTGTDAEATLGLVYSVGVNTPVKENLQPGEDYEDTLTITVISL